MELGELRAEVEALLRDAWGQAAATVDMLPLAGDASSRRYFRLRLTGTAPPTAVLMVQSGSGLSISSDELSTLEAPPAEMPFLNVQRYLASRGIAVPAVYGASSERGLALLEDVGDTTLWDAAQATTDPAALYRSAIDELIALQRAGAEEPDPRCIAFGQRFDARLFAWEFDHFLEYGLTGRGLAEPERARLRRRFEDLAHELADEPLVLTHRDYHSWNLFDHHGAIRVIDFQDALLAPLAYDLATLLNDRATPTIVTPAHEDALLAYFCARRAEAFGTGLDAESFKVRYYLFVLQKSLKIVGRFHYLEEVKGKPGYLAMLPHTFATLRRCFANLPGVGDLHVLLARAFPEIR
ncbi:MAG: phosphotransferase [Candidatus Binatia bacterium]